MKDNARRLLTGITAAVMSLSAVSAADIAALGSAVSAFAADGVAINEANFPDENFRKRISKFDTDNNNFLSESEISSVTNIDVVNSGIRSLDGIEYFSSLTWLYCYNNQLTSLDVSKNTALIMLACNENQLTSLDVSKNTALTVLNCGRNQLTSLDVSKNTALTSLLCHCNQLASLDVGKNTTLTELECGSNQLTSLDVSKNTALEILSCGSNQLTSLDISKNTAITELYCDGNEYTLKSNSLNELSKYGFDGSRASSWQGAEYDAATNSLRNIKSDAVKYSYNLGNDRTGTFTLKTDKISSSKPTPAPTPDPAKPVVTAEPTYGGAEVTWKPVDGAINYRVFTCVPGQKIRQFGSDTKGTSMTVKGLNGGQKTGIIVLAQFANKKWSIYTEDDIVYVTPLDAVKPYLCVNPKADGKVYLIWSSVPTSVRYKVMVREVGTKNWELIGATRQRCRITVDGFDPNKQCEFLVRGLNAKGKYTPMAADDIVVGTSLS